jgi:hypothetical protein
VQVPSPLYEFLPYVLYEVADRRRIDVPTPFYRPPGAPLRFSLAVADRRLLASQLF